MKYRLFRNITDPEAIKLYEWHIAQRRGSGFVDGNKPALSYYLPAARQLLASMHREGYWFNSSAAIPVDPNGDIMGGAHRVACALALGIDVNVAPVAETAWAPAWDAAWFRQHGMPEEELEDLIIEYAQLKGDLSEDRNARAASVRSDQGEVSAKG